RTSREGMIAAANSYFDAIEGDSGKIGAFADDCRAPRKRHPDHAHERAHHRHAQQRAAFEDLYDDV
ncbi:MAG TPA: hypothetical protein VLM42_09945, partial [Bryobacteraceae bacterium]|nr:hypothetical protein [Bryobacteraceae bacterium]